MPESKPDMKERADAALADLVRMFESGDMPKAVANTMIARTRNDRPQDGWSLSNQIIALYFARTEDARTYLDWKKAGRTVRKREDGGKAFYILAPIKVMVDDTDKDGKPCKRPIVVGFKGTPRFAIEVTDGEPIEYADHTPPELPPLMNVAERLGVKVKYVAAGADTSVRGSYHLNDNSVTLGTHDVDTFFHELAHAAHATIETLKGGQNARQEIIAESVAAALCLMYGYEGYVQESRSYVEFYGKNAGKAVVRLLADISKVLDVILETASVEEPVAA